MGARGGTQSALPAVSSTCRKRSPLEAFLFKPAPVAGEGEPSAGEGEPSAIDEVHEAINSGVEWNVKLQKEVDLLCGDGDGKTVFNQLYNTEDDTNFTNLDPQAIMGVVQKHCIMLFTVANLFASLRKWVTLGLRLRCTDDVTRLRLALCRCSQSGAVHRI